LGTEKKAAKDAGSDPDLPKIQAKRVVEPADTGSPKIGRGEFLVSGKTVNHLLQAVETIRISRYF
jgi:hypothetical protein